MIETSIPIQLPIDQYFAGRFRTYAVQTEETLGAINSLQALQETLHEINNAVRGGEYDLTDKENQEKLAAVAYKYTLKRLTFFKDGKYLLASIQD